MMEFLEVSCLGDLIGIIKGKFKDDVSDEDIIIRKKGKNLDLKAPISELYNKEDEPLVITNGRHYIDRI